MRPLNTPYEYHLSCLGAKAVVVAKTQDEAARKARLVNQWFDHHYRKGAPSPCSGSSRYSIAAGLALWAIVALAVLRAVA